MAQSLKVTMSEQSMMELCTNSNMISGKAQWTLATWRWLHILLLKVVSTTNVQKTETDFHDVKKLHLMPAGITSVCSMESCTIWHPHKQYTKVSISDIFISTYFPFFMIATLEHMIEYLMFFIWISLIPSDVQILFMCFWSFRCVLLKKYLFNSFVNFRLLVFRLLVRRIVRLFYVFLANKSLSHMSFENICSHSVSYFAFS